MCRTETKGERSPVACTLSGASLATQAARWTALRRAAGIARTELEDGVRLTFRDTAAVEDELHGLVAVENDCCAWATWTVERAEGELVMHAASSGDGVPTLHSMFKG